MRLGPHFVWATPCVKHEKSRTAKSAKHTHHYKLDSSQIHLFTFWMLWFPVAEVPANLAFSIPAFWEGTLRVWEAPADWWQRTRMINIVTLDNDEQRCSKGCIGDMHLWHGCVEVIGMCTSLGAGMLWGFMSCIFSSPAMLRLEELEPFPTEIIMCCH